MCARTLGRVGRRSFLLHLLSLFTTYLLFLLLTFCFYYLLSLFATYVLLLTQDDLLIGEDGKTELHSNVLTDLYSLMDPDGAGVDVLTAHFLLTTYFLITTYLLFTT